MPQNVKLSVMFDSDIRTAFWLFTRVYYRRPVIKTLTFVHSLNKKFTFSNTLINFLYINWIAFTGIMHILDE